MDDCRSLIELDVCHLKDPLESILLTSISTDLNDGMYPVTWTQIEAERNDSWDWFLDLLKVNLHMENVRGYSFISIDRKG